MLCAKTYLMNAGHDSLFFIVHFLAASITPLGSQWTGLEKNGLDKKKKNNNNILVFLKVCGRSLNFPPSSTVRNIQLFLQTFAYSKIFNWNFKFFSSSAFYIVGCSLARFFFFLLLYFSLYDRDYLICNCQQCNL